MRVLICDDSRLFAAALRRVLEHDPDIAVAAVCETAEDALVALPRVKPDLVTMDIELPGMQGLSAVEEIMSSWPVPILVLSSQVRRGDRAAKALAAGALDAVSKDDVDLSDPAGSAATAFRHRIRVLSRARVIRHPRARLPGAARPSVPLGLRETSVIGMCASTGGPPILARLISALPAGYAIPVLVVQHIAAGFTDGLAQWLDQMSAVPVVIAGDGDRAGPGVWIAPEGAHLTLAPDGTLCLDPHTVAGRHRPAADVLFKSIAETAGRSALGIVLSGMGTDGAVGAAMLHKQGGLVVAQDEASSAVFGMPKAAIDAGADYVMTPEEIAGLLLKQQQAPLPVHQFRPGGVA